LKGKILQLLDADSRSEFLSRLAAKAAEGSARKTAEITIAAQRSVGGSSELVPAPVPARGSNGNGHAHHLQK
jgi:hypothetical protein